MELASSPGDDDLSSVRNSLEKSDILTSRLSSGYASATALVTYGFTMSGCHKPHL
jgi:hypothetical protein